MPSKRATITRVESVIPEAQSAPEPAPAPEPASAPAPEPQRIASKPRVPIAVMRRHLMNEERLRAKIACDNLRGLNKAALEKLVGEEFIRRHLDNGGDEASPEEATAP